VKWVERTTSKKGKMVVEGEGRGKFSSPHSIKYFGDQSLPKWGGMIQIGSLFNFSSILVLSRWKNWRNWLVGPILVVGPSSEIWGLKPSKSILRYQIKNLGVKTFQGYLITF
jgi:hypothetical protein